MLRICYLNVLLVSQYWTNSKIETQICGDDWNTSISTCKRTGKYVLQNFRESGGRNTREKH